MRSDLKAVGGITEIETDLDQLTCCFVIAESIDIEALLDELAESNSKIAEWSIEE